jgi:hypothetical protein
MNGRQLCDLNILASVHSRFDDTHPALESKIDEVPVQHELHGQAGIVCLKYLDSIAVGQKQWAFFVVGHSYILPLLAVVSKQFDQTAVLNKWELSNQIETATADNPAVLNCKLHGTGLLTVLGDDVVNPPIAHLERQKIGGHSHTGLRQQRSREHPKQQRYLPKYFHGV